MTSSALGNDDSSAAAAAAAFRQEPRCVSFQLDTPLDEICESGEFSEDVSSSSFQPSSPSRPQPTHETTATTTTTTTTTSDSSPRRPPVTRTGRPTAEMSPTRQSPLPNLPEQQPSPLGLSGIKPPMHLQGRRHRSVDEIGGADRTNSNSNSNSIRSSFASLRPPVHLAGRRHRSAETLPPPFPDSNNNDDDDNKSNNNAAPLHNNAPPPTTTGGRRARQKSSRLTMSFRGNNNNNNAAGRKSARWSVRQSMRRSTKKLNPVIVQEEEVDYGYEDMDMESNPTEHRTRTNVAQRRVVIAATTAQYEINFYPGQVRAYCPPYQRQKWGETQVLPRVNWGDLFFDLHYVAATYNVSNILVQDPTWIGVLYAAGTFIPVMGIWTQNTFYSSRFSYDDDVSHKLADIATLVVLATTVLHIQPVSILQAAGQEISMFVFSLCLVTERLVSMAYCAEIYFVGIGQKRVLQRVAVREVQFLLFSTACYVAAALVAACYFFPRYYETVTKSADYPDDTYDDNEGYKDPSYMAEPDDAHVRYLAGGGKADSVIPSSDITHIPIILCLCGQMGQMLYSAISIIFFFPKNGSHKESTVPLNVDFVIHRFGEWTMLMLGESIFSILIVQIPDQSGPFFSTFYGGIMTVILLQYLHFKSQPHEADHHALRRDKDAGIGWLFLSYAYSLGLVCLGAAYTFLLVELSSAEDDSKEKDSSYGTDDYSGGGDSNSSYGDSKSGDYAGRFLAPSGGGSGDVDVLQHAAHIFSGSMAVIFLSLDGMTLFHLGLDNVLRRCVCPQTGGIHPLAILITILRVGVTVVIAFASQWETDPQSLTYLGLAIVVAQLTLRKLGNILSLNAKIHDDVSDDSSEEVSLGPSSQTSWPNVTRAWTAVHNAMTSFQEQSLMSLREEVEEDDDDDDFAKYLEQKNNVGGKAF